MTPSAGMTAKPCRCGKMAEAACNAMPNDWECGLEVPATKLDREDGFERGFVAGWKARGEHKNGLRNRAEEALDVLRSQLPDVVAEEDEIRRRYLQAVDAMELMADGHFSMGAVPENVAQMRRSVAAWLREMAYKP